MTQEGYSQSIEGHWYPAHSSTRHPASLKLDGPHFTISPKDQHALQGDFQQLTVSDRVGNIPRKLTLPDQSLFETLDNDAVDHLLEGSSHKAHRLTLIHRLETRWRWIATALVVTVLLSLMAVGWGIPWASKHIAHSLPISVHEIISVETMKALDGGILKPSKLPIAKQREIQQHFEWALLPLQNEEFRYQLHFRSMPMSPNAFALPSGDIIITDELIELAENQEEIDSVLLHEIGHVVHRHGMQQLLQSSFMTMTLIMITGEVSAIGEWAVAFPAFLLQSHYSRAHEGEADEFAFKKMIKAGIDPIQFAHIMQRLGDSSFGRILEETKKDKDTAILTSDVKHKKHTENTEEDNGLISENMEKALEYFLSHPATSDRVDKAHAYSEKFRTMKQ